MNRCPCLNDLERLLRDRELVQAMSAAGTAMAVLVATFALTNLSEDQAWRVALLFGGLPIILIGNADFGSVARAAR